MPYHPRIETTEMSNFITSRTRNSELWFINNSPLEQVVLGYTAKYATTYKVDLYAFAIEGNHLHTAAQFHHYNRSDFMRDLKAIIARTVPRHCPGHPGGTFWARRYSNEFLPAPDDIENQFFYTVLQPVQDGLVEKIADYPGYNCFHDAVWGIKRKKFVMNWTAYYEAKRKRRRVNRKDYLETYILEYKRLPGYEDLTQREYAHLMQQKLEARRVEIVTKRYAEGKGFVGKAALLRAIPGTLPHNTKTASRYSHRPRVLCVCPERRKETLDWYFALYAQYKEASLLYRNRNTDVNFPDGTYKPVLVPLEALH